MEDVIDGEMVLPDGRTLGYVEWGPSDGHVIALCHPATGVVQPGWETASAVGARIVLPDRPGFGRSTFAPGRTILDWASDVAAVMAHLGIDTFSVAGVSACTPYALACGVRLAGAVDAIGVIAGTVPRAGVGATAVASGLSPEDQQRVEAEARAEARDIPRSTARLAERPEPDGSLYRRPDVQAALVAAGRETYRQGPQAAAQDAILRLSPWGFDLASVTPPWIWWHGQLDAVVPAQQVQKATAGVGRCNLTIVPGVGHGVCMTHVEPFLRRLLDTDGR